MSTGIQTKEGRAMRPRNWAMSLLWVGVLCAAGEQKALLKPGETLLTIYNASRTAVSARVSMDGAATPSHALIEEQARQGGLAVVRQCRRIALPAGATEYRFTDVAARLDAATLQITDQTDPKGTRVLEQNYLYDLVGREAMLKRFVDRPVEFVDENRRSYSGTLLSDRMPIMLLTRRRAVEVINANAKKSFYVLRFPELPKSFVTRPTLVWNVRAKQAGDHDVVVAYQTGGLAWRTDYTAVINGDDTRLDLSAWVTIANVSGARYPNAQVKLIAGDVRRIVEVSSPKQQRRGYGQADEDDKPPAPAPTEAGTHRAIGDNYLYALPHRTTLEHNQTKQIQLLHATDVPVKKVYTYDALMGRWRWGDYTRDETYGQRGRKTVRVNLQLDNRRAHGLGIPLPAGIVRANKLDPADGSLEFIGEDRLDHAPAGARVRLYIGDAFDIVGERTQTDFRWPERNQLYESFKIELRNHKDQPVTVHVLEHLYRWENWVIEKPSHPFAKLDSGTIEFAVPVAARGKATVTYTAHYSWPHPVIQIQVIEKKAEDEKKPDEEEKKEEDEGEKEQ